MTRPRPPLRLDAQRNRDAVLTAALGLLAERPDASMQEIAEASGVGRTTVYRHFPAREDLVRAIFARVGDEARAMAAGVVAEGGGAEAILRRLGAEIVALGERYHFLEAHREVGESEFEGPEGTPDPVLEWIRAAHAAGELHQSAPADWQYRMLRGLAVAASEEVTSGRRTADEAGPLLGDVFVHAFVA